MNTVLVVAPHMDDEVLGCGGAIARHVKAGDTVHVCFIAHRKYNNTFDSARNDIEKQHAAKAQALLGYQEAVYFDLEDECLDQSIQDIVIPLEAYITDLKPSILYGPFLGDNNQDHRAVANALRVASRPMVTQFIKKIYAFEVPSSTDQSPPIQENAFLPSFFINIEEAIDTKIAALMCYETEARTFPHPRSHEGIRALAMTRGMMVGMKAAEAFMVLKTLWD